MKNLEVVVPNICPRIEKTDKLFRIDIKQRTKITTFVAVAKWTRPSQIIRVGTPTVF